MECTCNHSAGLQHSLDNAEGIMQGAVHLIKHVIVGATQQHCHSSSAFAALQHDHVIISYCLLRHLQAPDALISMAL